MSFRTIPNDRLIDWWKLDLISITQQKNLDDVVTNADLSNKVDKTTTVNSKPLSSDITLTTDDIPEGIKQYDKVVSILNGAWISVTWSYPNFTVTNSSPDQVVNLTAGTNVTITGSYPNFTINSTATWTWDVTADWTLTTDTILLGGGNKVAKSSSKTIVTTLGSDDTTIPTSKAVKNETNTKVPTTRTVNGKALSSDISITASDVGAPSGSGTSTWTNTGDDKTWVTWVLVGNSGNIQAAVSGTDIKTVNGQSVLWSGDIEITSWGGGGFTPVYLTNLTSSTVPAYKQTSYTPDVSETIVSAVANNNEVLAQSYIYDGDIWVTTINSWSWVFDLYAYVSSAVGITKFRIETFKRTAWGTETTLFSVDSWEINNTTRALHQFTTTQWVFSCNATDRLGTRVYVNTTANINITASFIVWDGNASFFTTPLQLRASQVRNTPSGNISSTDVQGAINELDSEKVTNTRTLTINGTAYDLSADRSWTVSWGGWTPDYLLLSFWIL